MAKLKVAIIQKIPVELMGVMFVGAVINKSGHECEVFISDLDGAGLLKNVKKYSPDLIAFTLMSADYRWFNDVMLQLKNMLPDIPVIVGGPHATFYPEIIENYNIKALFLGEGEGSLEEFLCNYGNENKLKTTKGLWYKDGAGNIYKNEMRFLCQNLDELPFPNRSNYYDKYESLNMTDSKIFMTSRGCPSRCNFCCNKKYQIMYQGKGKYVRHFSQERIIREIKETKNKYLLKSINFVDDAFTQDPRWLMKFLPMYKKEIHLPFKCGARADMMTDELAKALKDAGVNVIMFGVESGNENIRNNVLNKKVKDKYIIECAGILKRNGIQFGTFNMFGIPSETVENAFQTVEMNMKIKTDLPFGSVLIPYPQTEVAEQAVRLKMLPKDFDFKNLPPSFLSSSPLIMPDKHVYENIQKAFYFAVKYPFTYPILKKLVRINCPVFFKALFALSFILRFSKERKEPLWKAVKVAWEFRKSY